MAWIKAYKGFNKDMTCRGFQYEEGKEYTTDKAELCKSGFHACEYPLDCLNYYNPTESEYHAVDLDATDEQRSDDTKRVGKSIKVGAKLSIKNLVEASIEYINERIDKNSKNSATGHGSANSATGDWSANSATGYGSANVTTGKESSNKGSEGTVNVGWGKNNKCKGEIGAYIVLSECGEWDGNKFPILNAKMGKIDGITLKPDTWYTLKNGEFVEVEDE